MLRDWICALESLAIAFVFIYNPVTINFLKTEGGVGCRALAGGPCAIVPLRLSH